MPRPPPRSFLLRLWRDSLSAPWCATLVAVAQPETPQHFATLDALFAFLLAQTDPAATVVEVAQAVELDTTYCTAEDWSPLGSLSQGETQ